MENKTIEIPFEAKDSELKGWEYTIPDNMEAEIKDGKIIVKRKKSEDEKIRKEIIAFMQSMNSHCNPSQDWDLRNRWLPYLERQKEQKSFNDTQEYLKGVARVQDYDELTEFEKVFDRIADTYAHRKNKDGYNEPWYTKERAAEMLYHAKKELGLCLEQKPAEWSEEDEIKLASLINYFEGDALDCSTEDMARWLKSLRPSWKPSEEQMGALISKLPIITGTGNKVDSILESLYDDLKKL